MRKVICAALLLATALPLSAASRRRAIHSSAGAAPAPITVQYGADAGRTGATSDLGPKWLETEVWERQLPGTVYGLVQDRDIIYAGSTGGVYAVNAVTGADLWVFPQANVQFSPVAVVGDTVYVAGGNVFYALDRATGSLLWSLDAGASIEKSAPLIVDDFAYVGSSAGNVHAIDLEAHTEAWRRNLGSPVRTRLTSAKGILLAVTDAGLRALRINDGADRWSKAAPAGSFWSPVATDGKLVYSGASSDDFYAIELNTGKTEWTFTDANLTPFAGPWSAPVVRNGVVASGNANGLVFGFNTKDGSRKWLFVHGYLITDAVIGANGSMYFGETDDGRTTYLVSFNFDRGSEDALRFIIGTSFGAPAIVNGVAYIHYSGVDGTQKLAAFKD